MNNITDLYKELTESMVMEAIKLGAIDFIVKPFKPDRLLQVVRKTLG